MITETLRFLASYEIEPKRQNMGGYRVFELMATEPKTKGE